VTPPLEDDMKIRGPFVTLLAGVVVAGVLLGLSVAAKRINTPKPLPAAAPAAAPTPSASASAFDGAQPPDAVQPAPSLDAPTPSPTSIFQATYAGTVVGGGASLAIVVKNDRAVAYLCDGKRIEAWYQGTANGGQLNLTGKAGQSLAGTYDAASASGTVNAAGRTYRFTLKLVTPPSGLYRSSANLRAKVDAAWIVDEKRQQTGVFREAGGEPAAAPRLDTSTLTAQINGQTVTVASIDGSNGTG
jgi:serine/threonine-protein kinase